MCFNEAVRFCRAKLVMVIIELKDLLSAFRRQIWLPLY